MNTTQAISELNQFLSFKKASEHAEAVLKKLQDAEHETKAAEKALASLKAEIESLGKVKDKAKAVLDKAEDQAASIIEKADAAKAGIIADAENEKVKILTEASNMLTEMNNTIAKNKNAYNESLALQASLQEKKKELESDQARLDKVKADLAAIINVKA